MTTYDDHADLLGEACEYCGKINNDCMCDTGIKLKSGVHRPLLRHEYRHECGNKQQKQPT